MADKKTERKIIDFLRLNPKTYYDALKIAQGVKMKTKHDVNPTLYDMKKRRVVRVKDEDAVGKPLWRLRTKHRVAETADETADEPADESKRSSAESTADTATTSPHRDEDDSPHRCGSGDLTSVVVTPK